MYVSYHYVCKNLDSSNKVDSVDCTTVECVHSLCELAIDPAITQASKQLDATQPSAIILLHWWQQWEKDLSLHGVQSLET